MSKKLVTFNGSPRQSGNTAILLDHFLAGAKEHPVVTDVFNVQDLNLEYCRGCLRCNTLGYCSNQDDDWSMVSEKILAAEVLVFATPIYFHHVSAPMKKLIDRFRSFVEVRITETGLMHTPHENWEKDFVLLLTMGSSDPADATPVIELFEFITSILGPENKLHILTANRQVVVRQLTRTEEELTKLYRILKLPEHLAAADAAKNRKLLDDSKALGSSLLT